MIPWAVGRYNYNTYDSIAAGSRWYSPDLLGVISHSNLAIYNQIPRLKGDFIWKQVAGAKAASATALYLAMFDEIDEGTTYFKCAVEGKLPVFGAERPERRFIGIEEGLNSDYYLWLADEADKWIKGASGYNATKPGR